MTIVAIGAGMRAKAKTLAKSSVKAQAVAAKPVKAVKTRTMAAGQFKTLCLAVIDEVHNRHEEVVITKHGKPMARLVPFEQAQDNPEEIFGFMRGRMRILGDIISPIDPPEGWNSEK
jgi:antitoxin (DNA-binding transcriptional repressor) of toxin-antitoxin stability system